MLVPMHCLREDSRNSRQRIDLYGSEILCELYICSIEIPTLFELYPRERSRYISFFISRSQFKKKTTTTTNCSLRGERVAVRADAVGVWVLVHVLMLVPDQAEGSVLPRGEAVRGLLRPLLLRVVFAVPGVPRAPESRVQLVYWYRDLCISP